ncbi:MAG: hypothetical protein ACRYGK_02470 [Janthinobacterium lividum]
MAVLDWAQSSAINPGQFSDVHRIAFELAGLLESNGKQRVVYMDVDDIDNTRRQTQGVGQGIKMIEDVDATGGVPARFEGLGHDESELKNMYADIQMTGAQLEHMAVATNRAHIILGSSPADIVQGYHNARRRLDPAFAASYMAMENSPAVLQQPGQAMHLGTILATYDRLCASSTGIAADEREQGRVDITRAVLLGPFQNALLDHQSFQTALDTCGLNDERFHGAMLEIASRCGVKDLPALEVGMKSAVFWHSGSADIVETTEDFTLHKEKLKQRFLDDLAPRSQAAHLAKHFATPPHEPGMMALHRNQFSVTGHQNSISAYGQAGIEATETVAFEIGRSVFETHLPGSAFKPAPPGLLPLRQAMRAEFERILAEEPPEKLRLAVEKLLLAPESTMARVSAGPAPSSPGSKREPSTSEPENRFWSMASQAQWSNIGERLLGDGQRHLANAYVAAQRQVDERYPAVAGTQRTALLMQTVREMLARMGPAEKAIDMLEMHGSSSVLFTTGPEFFSRLGQENMANLLALDDNGLQQFFGNLFAVDAHQVSLKRQNDGSWR